MASCCGGSDREDDSGGSCGNGGGCDHLLAGCYSGGDVVDHPARNRQLTSRKLCDATRGSERSTANREDLLLWKLRCHGDWASLQCLRKATLVRKSWCRMHRWGRLSRSPERREPESEQANKSRILDCYISEYSKKRMAVSFIYNERNWMFSPGWNAVYKNSSYLICCVRLPRGLSTGIVPVKTWGFQGPWIFWKNVSSSLKKYFQYFQGLQS